MGEENLIVKMKEPFLRPQTFPQVGEVLGYEFYTQPMLCKHLLVNNPGLVRCALLKYITLLISFVKTPDARPNSVALALLNTPSVSLQSHHRVK